MRATISFEIDVDKVEETMAALVEQQSDTLRLVTNILDNVGKSTLLEEVTEALDLLEEASSQLQQYRRMLVNFERARFETILPQDSDEAPLPASVGQMYNNLEELRASLNNMKDFTNFVDNIKTEEQPDEPQEGRFSLFTL